MSRAHWQPLRSPDSPRLPDLGLTFMGLNGFQEALSDPACVLYFSACCDDNSGVATVTLRLFQQHTGPKDSIQTTYASAWEDEYAMAGSSKACVAAPVLSCAAQWAVPAPNISWLLGGISWC